MSKNLLINANDMSIFEPRRYYQEYEGTFITVSDKSEDDTLDTSRYIEVTEIWGNTVQDENNLEDIQSVGELYVDEEGQPILDDLGREQYKIEIESCNNLLNLDNLINNKNSNFIVENEYLKLTGTSAGFSSNHAYITLKMYKDITYSFKAIWNNVNNWNHFAIYDDNNQRVAYLNSGSPLYKTFSPTQTQMYKIMLGGAVGDLIPISSVQVYEGSNNIDIGENQSNKTTILLPCQLQKVGDVYDRLYWDSEKRKYVVEKNISKKTLVETCNWFNQTETDEFITKYVLTSFYSNAESYDVICTTLPTITTYNATQKGICGRNAVFYVSLPKSELTSFDSNGFNAWLTENPSYFYYKFKIPQLIETNITEKIQLPCYSEKTHIFVNSTVDATMKVLVPYKEII